MSNYRFALAGSAIAPSMIVPAAVQTVGFLAGINDALGNPGDHIGVPAMNAVVPVVGQALKGEWVMQRFQALNEFCD